MKSSELLKIFLRFFSANRKLIFFLLFYVSFITFFLRGYFLLDPDFGWRYKVGEIIFREGIPKTDPFSYTMPSFAFVDHAWFISLLIFLTFSIFKNGVMSLFLAFLVFASIHISNKRIESGTLKHSGMGEVFEKWFHPLTLTAIAFLFLFFFVRAQIVSWFFFATLNLILFGKDLFTRYKYFIPLYFLVWANVHGGYSLGMMEFGFFVFFRVFFSKKGHLKDLAIFALSILATLATPYGLGGWREVASSVFDSRLRWSIAEWMPSVFYFDISLVFFIALSAIMLHLKRKDVPKIQRYIFWGLLFFGITSRRNMPYFILYALPLVIFSIGKFYDEVKNSKISEERFQIFYSSLRIFAIAILSFQLYANYWRGVFNSPDKTSGFYPKEAVLYLKEKEIQGRIFSSYGWGGYLIWQLPDEKVFIDGRMPSWKFNPPAETNESASAYDDYLDITSGESDFNLAADMFDIKYVLWPVERKTFFSQIEEKIRGTGILGEEEEKFIFRDYLEKNDWMIVYSDDTSLVFKRFNSEKL